MALVELRNISKSYPRRNGLRNEEHFVVTDVSLMIERGETLGLVGESGSGKSTVARILLGLIPATSGTVKFAGTESGGGQPRGDARFAAPDAAGIPGSFRGAKSADEGCRYYCGALGDSPSRR